MRFERRTFLRLAATASVAGSASIEYGSVPAAAAAGTDCGAVDTVPKIEFYSSASQVDPNYGALTDESVVAVWAEPTATNADDDGNGDAYVYDDLTPIPLTSVDRGVYGFGAILLQDDDVDFDYGNEEFVLNAWDAELGGSGTVLWDEGHGQYYTLDTCSQFESYAEDNGYAVAPTTSLASDLSNADAAVITSPGEAFSSAELDALVDFVSNGGALFLHDQSDYSDYDGTGYLNDIAASLDLAYRFNDDDVNDGTNNVGGDDYDVLTSQFNANAFDLFADRSGIGLDAGVRYEATVDSVTDGDTVDVTFADGTSAEVRLLGFDSPETKRNGRYEKVEEWEGIEDDGYLADWGESAKDYATQELDGEAVEIEIDAAEDVWDPFGRLLAYVYYDQDGDGSVDTLFNEEMVAKGYARVYGSNLTKHDAFWEAEDDARANGLRVWQESDPENTSEVRDRAVEAVFVPNASSVRTGGGAISPSRVPVFAESTATQDLRGGVAYDGDVPLVGVDSSARVAVIGGLPIDEEYRGDVTDYEHEVFLTNLVDSLSDRTGQILVEGGHGQFNERHSLSNEDAVAYQRYLEGQGIAFEQVNSLDGVGDNALSTARALVVTSPRSCYSSDEVDALRAFVDDGGAVIMMGSGYGKIAPDTRNNFNDLAAALGTDLRLNADHVFDDDHNVNDDPALLYTANLNTSDFSLWDPYS
ncbi:DUF4350 domain-containing protein [Halegenticoccus soli]|uniref:DUF4350 domain-containing protein n=1 Tax=Halegenticoccus soli TaxID=1985678 RepID=UPI000C6EAB57|nr:DUF4350 domain-containing protein [Halegenticoccus soli]